MKTQAMDKAKTAVSDCLYPFKSQLGTGYPSTAQFEVMQTADGLNPGVKALVAFDSRVCIAKISGYALGEQRPYTLQLSPRVHLYDCWFCGLFLQSCNPNVFVDKQYLEVWSLRKILAGDLLTIDYANTEDNLPRQFRCQCGELNCRLWITGSKEHLNAEGLAFMAAWLEPKRP